MHDDLAWGGLTGPLTGPHALPPGAKAWLLLDWDGVLNVVTSNSQARKRKLRRVKVYFDGFAYRFRLHKWLDNATLAADHPHLAPGWATSWWFEVNDFLGNRIHLGPWPAAKLDYYNDDPQASKLDGILAMVGDAPFVWIDDAPLPGDLDRIATLPQPALLLIPRDDVGLTPDLLDQASKWAAAL